MRRILHEHVLMRKIQGWLTIFWIIMIPISWFTGLVHSVSFISLLSLLALVLSQGAWWAAVSVEAQRDEEDVSSEVVEAMIEGTDVSESP